jgi:hypothetical protein
MSRARADATLWRIFRWPLLLALVSIAGLVGALVGDNAWDVLSWLCLGSLPLLVVRLYRRGRMAAHG